MLGLMVFIALHKLTGDVIHEWLAVALIPFLLWHLCWNWKLITGVGRRLFQRGFAPLARFNFVWNILLYTTMGVVILSGILISRDFLPRLGIFIPNDGFVSYIHKRSVLVLYVLLGVHFGTHWDWICATTKRFFCKAETQNEAPSNTTEVQP